jgi:membrane fusion protein (multidrug efflux system)
MRNRMAGGNIRMAKRMAFMVIGLMVVFGGIFGWKAVQRFYQNKYFSHYEPPPVVAAAARAKLEIWQTYLSTIGNLTAVDGVKVSTEVPGIVQKIDFKSGQNVHAGDLLVHLDDLVDKADLKNFQARLKLIQMNYTRERALFKKEVVAKKEYDTLQAQLKEAEAQVAKTKAIIAQKTIRAPFDGMLGIRKVNVGQYLSPGTEIVPLQSLDPLYLNFSLPQQKLSKLHIGQTVLITVDTYPDKVFQGNLTAINSKVDELTYNIALQATLPNDNHQLYPGMFAEVRVLSGQPNRWVTVPQTAIVYSLYGDSVFVIKPDDSDPSGRPVLKVTCQYIQIQDRRDGEVAIKSGLVTGDQIVTAGQLKLENGTRVVINNSVNFQ